jgi:hypothetical protein
VRSKLIALAAVFITTQACATLQQLSRVVQPPTFEAADDRETEWRSFAPSLAAPLGGAAVRLWTTVTNPNPIGVMLSTVRATLILEGERAAEGDFPLGLPLEPREASTIPLDLRVSFSDVPELASALRNVLRLPGMAASR